MTKQWLRRYNLLPFNTLDSTHLEAKRLLESGISGNSVIWAESQTSGRGRYGRRWESQCGNLYLSIILDSQTFCAVQSQLSFVASLSVYRAITLAATKAKKKLDLGLKWPNDVLVNGSKISGILLESVKRKDHNYLILGIGLNIANYPTNIDRNVTSMHALDLDEYNVTEMLNLVMESFDHYYLLWQQKGFMYIRNLWMKKIYNPQDVMTVNDGKNRISGMFQSIDHNGAIVLKLSSGQIYTFTDGEVSL